MKRIYVFVILSLLVSACGSQPIGKADLSSSCESLQPTESDVQFALNYGKDLFTNVNWIRSYTVKELQATVSWTHRTTSAIADISLFLFCDETGTENISWFYSDEALQVLFQDYDSATLTASCDKDGLLLYELEAIEENQTYDIRLWAEPLNKSRLLSVLLTFPKEENTLLNKYSQEFFPQLASCP
jgi:hypothetical protein